MIAKCAVYGITVQEVPILIEVQVGIGELAVAAVALAETSETGGMTVQEVPILIEALVGIGELAIAAVALAETSETQVMAISDNRRDTMAILKIIDLICYTLLKYVISLTFQYLVLV